MLPHFTSMHARKLTPPTAKKHAGPSGAADASVAEHRTVTAARQPMAAGTVDPDRHFRVDQLQKDLKSASVRGGVATLSGQAASLLLNVGSIAVLARLLTPDDFGLIAMVTAVTGFVEMFKDAGLSMATVQRAEINHEQVSTLFWINVALSLTLMLIVVALAPSVAWFYGEPRLTGVTLTLAGTFVLGGLAIQHQALLRRQMRFGTLAVISVLSRTIGTIVAIAAAALGAGYWALVAMMATNSLAGAVLVWLFCSWRPGLPRRGSGVRPMLAFGGNLTAFSFLNYWTRNADNLLIGWCWGTFALGLYSRAYSLMLLPMGQIRGPLGAVAIPALSRLQDNREEFARFYLRAVNTMLWICGPLVAFLAARAAEVVLLVLGDQWLACVGIFKILAIVAFFQPIYSTMGWIIASRGESERMFRWSLIACPAMVAAFGVGLPFGPTGVATAYAVIFIAVFPWTMSYSFRGTAVTLTGLARVACNPLLLSVLIYAVLACTTSLGSSTGPLAEIVVSLALAAAVLVVAATFIPSIRKELRGFLTLARHGAPLFARRAQFAIAALSRET